MAQFVAQALGALPVVADVGEQALGALVVQLDAREVGSLKVAVHDRDVLGILEVARQQSAAGVAPAAQQLYGGRALGVAEADPQLEAAPPGRLGRRLLLADEAPEVAPGPAYQPTGHGAAAQVDQHTHPWPPDADRRGGKAPAAPTT